MGKKAFTLVEILVVIGILILLAGVTYSVYGPAKKRSKVSGCTANLRQYGIALELYAADHDDKLARAPSYWMKYWALTGGPHYGEPHDSVVRQLPHIELVLKSYGLETRLSRCPLDHKADQSRRVLPPGMEFISSYTYDDWNALKPLAFSQYPDPSVYVLVNDFNSGHDEPQNAPFAYWKNPRNALHVDLHVRLRTHGYVTQYSFDHPGFYD